MEATKITQLYLVYLKVVLWEMILKIKVLIHFLILIEDLDHKVKYTNLYLNIDVGGNSSVKSKSERKGGGRMLMMKNRLNNNST
jgi:hypothetical protein